MQGQFKIDKEIFDLLNEASKKLSWTKAQIIRYILLKSLKYFISQIGEDSLFLPQIAIKDIK